MTTSIYTHTLSSGKILTVSTEIAFADAVTCGLLLLFTALLCVYVWQELQDA